MTENKRSRSIGKIKGPPLPRHVRYPPLDEETILRWADDHHARTGEWPNAESGQVAGGYGDTWSAINQCLGRGLRGLAGGSSIFKLLNTERSVPSRVGEMIRVRTDTPQAEEIVYTRLDIEMILAWADAHFERTGSWPTTGSGQVSEAPEEDWRRINRSLYYGARGLPRSGCLARLLLEERGARNRLSPEEITREEIVGWADRYFERHGRWPRSDSGAVEEKPELTWARIDQSLINGARGLPAGSSIARLLDEERGVRNVGALQPLTDELILEWADAYRDRHGRWPNINSGEIPESRGDTWRLIDNALSQGNRGFAAGSTLARLLAERRGMRNPVALPTLSVEQVLRWADSYFESTGRWPSARSGPIPEAPGETWSTVDHAFMVGHRGLSGGSSLAKFLRQERNREWHQQSAALTLEQILVWADAYYADNGTWPTFKSGPISGAPGETWAGINAALRHGSRCLPHGDTLVSLLARERGRRTRAHLSPLTEQVIIGWAKQHFLQTGRWPTQNSGPIAGQPGETWSAIDDALWRGARELPGWSSLPLLLDTIRKPTK